MPDILLNIFIGLVVASIGAIATKSYQVAKHHRRNAHLYSLLAPKGRVQIVVPAFTVTDFVPLGTSDPATVPSNLRAMPMAEGGAIAQMVTMLHSLGCGEYRLVPTEAFQDNAHLTISFGGPSVNPVSDNILRK